LCSCVCVCVCVCVCALGCERTGMRVCMCKCVCARSPSRVDVVQASAPERVGASCECRGCTSLQACRRAKRACTCSCKRCTACASGGMQGHWVLKSSPRTASGVHLSEAERRHGASFSPVHTGCCLLRALLRPVQMVGSGEKNAPLFVCWVRTKAAQALRSLPLGSRQG